MNRSESPSTALRAPSPPLGEKDGMRGYGSWNRRRMLDTIFVERPDERASSGFLTHLRRGKCHTPNLSFQPLNSGILAVILPGHLDCTHGQKLNGEKGVKKGVSPKKEKVSRKGKGVSPGYCRKPYPKGVSPGYCRRPYPFKQLATVCRHPIRKRSAIQSKVITGKGVSPGYCRKPYPFKQLATVCRHPIRKRSAIQSKVITV